MLYSNTDHFLANITIDIAVYSQLNCGNFTAVPSTKEQVCYHFPHLVTTWPLILRLNLANTREAALQAYSCHFHDNKLNLKKNYCLFIGEPGSQEFPRLWQNPLPHVSVFLAVLLPPPPPPPFFFPATPSPAPSGSHTATPGRRPAGLQGGSWFLRCRWSEG